MNTALKWTLIGIVGVVGLAAIGVGWLMSSLGGFETVEASYPDACTRIVDMPGAEDIAPDYSSGFAYVSSDDRWAYAAGDDKAGAIYRIDMKAEIHGAPVKMAGTENLKNFHPHGMDLFQDGDRKLLFVISHRAPEAPIAGHDIYVFEISDRSLQLVETFSGNAFRSPNDLVAVGPRQFYFSNDRANLEKDGALLEVLFGQAVTDISFFDGTDSTIVAGDLAFANGVAISADGKTIYATQTRGGVTNLYRRDTQTNALEPLATIPTGNGPDNITRAEDGSIWVTTHVNSLALSAHTEDPSALSPVRVFELDEESQTAHAVYEDDGGLISAASVAVPYQDKLFIGSIYQDWILACDR